MKLTRTFLVFWLGWSVVGVGQAQVPLRMNFYFPQIVDGDLDEEDEFRTMLVLNNPGEAEATGTLSIFAQDGTPLEMSFRVFAGSDILGGDVVVAEDGVLNFQIPPEGMVQVITTSLVEETIVAYGKVVSDVGMSGMAIFGRFKIKEEENKFEVEIESQAAVEATGTMTVFAVTDFRQSKFKSETDDFEFEFESATATGLAVVNTGSMPTTLTLMAKRPNGEEVGQAEIELAAGEHRSFFLGEVLEVPEDVIVGTVIGRSSETEVSAVALKFDTESDQAGLVNNEFTIAPLIQLAP